LEQQISDWRVLSVNHAKKGRREAAKITKSGEIPAFGLELWPCSRIFPQEGKSQ